MTLAELAERIGARVDGDGSRVVTGVSPIEEAGPDQVTFVSNSKYARFAKTTAAGAIVASERIEGSSSAFLISGNPYHAFALAVAAFNPPFRPEPGISERAFVHPTAVLGKDVHIGPFAVVSEGARLGDRVTIEAGSHVGRETTVGDDTLLYPRVVLYDKVTVGARVILHSGVVVGSDGFGFAPGPTGFQKIPQVGTVVIEDDVELGANTTIDRGGLGTTRIGKGTKLDNLVHVAHNVTIGGHTVMAAQSGIAGSTKVGSGCMIGGQVAISGHIEVGDGIMVAGQSGIAHSVDASHGGNVWSGTPVMPHKTWLRLSVLMPKVPDLFRRVRALEDTVQKQSEKGE